MNQDEVFESLKTYFETRPAARWAISLLKPGAEVGLVIGHQINCAIFNKGGIPAVEKREAVRPTFVFFMPPESIETLLQFKTEEIGVIGTHLFTEILAGNIRFEFRGDLKDILSGGYLDILKSSGDQLTGFIKTQGFLSIMKVMAFIDKMKNTKTS